jgi:hypothetical protein
MKFPWKIYHGSKFIDSGHVEAKDEREGMSKVLGMSHKNVIGENCYCVTVGNTVTSSYGDEFERTGSVTKSGSDSELDPVKGGYLFKEECKAVLKDPGCTKSGRMDNRQPNANGSMSCKHPNMNGDAYHPITGEKHAQCQDCGYISPKGTGVFKNDDAVRRSAGPYYLDPPGQDQYDHPCSHGHDWQRINLRGDQVCGTCGERKGVAVHNRLADLKPGEYVLPQHLTRPQSNKSILLSTFGPDRYEQVKQMLASRGHRITDVRSVSFDHPRRVYTIQGEFEDENGCRMGWQFQISDLMFH